jgi:hypothetical protein
MSDTRQFRPPPTSVASPPSPKLPGAPLFGQKSNIFNKQVGQEDIKALGASLKPVEEKVGEMAASCNNNMRSLRDVHPLFIQLARLGCSSKGASSSLSSCADG